jgi:hypothetical protein
LSPLYQMPFRSISHEQKIQSVTIGPNRTLGQRTADGGYESLVVNDDVFEVLTSFSERGTRRDGKTGQYLTSLETQCERIRFPH